MRRAILISLLAVCVAPPFSAAQETLHGFVVGIPSANSVNFDDFSVTRDNRLSLTVNSNPGKPPNTLRPGDLRVGDEVEINGNYDTGTHQLVIKGVKIVSVDSREFRSTAFADRPSELQRTASGWNGYVFLDGMRIRVANSTRVSFRRTERELSDIQKQQNGVVPAKTVPLTALDEIGPNTIVGYQGVSLKDGSVLASRLEFENFELTPGEFERLRKIEPRIQKGDPLIAQPDELRVGRSKYKLVPSPEAQRYIQKLGESLIPPRQRELTADSTTKIDYRFYLVEDKEFNVVAFPNGVIVVNSGLLEGLEDEAQLAFHISRAVTQVEEMDAWRLSRYYSSPGHKALQAAAIGAELAPFVLMNVPTLIVASKNEDFADSLRDQADRLALEWMLAAGYDIREAPRAYKVYALAHPDHKPLYPKPDANQVEKNEWASARRVFLMTELRTNYSGTDYSKLKKDTEQFHELAKHALSSAR